MLDFQTYRSACENPDASKAFIKTLSPYELLQILNNSSDNTNYDIDSTNLIIDCDDVIEGIMEAGCEGKLLILASRSNLGSFDNSQKLINLISRMGVSFQAALLSNPRINWYLFFSFDESGFLDKELDTIIHKDSRLSPVFYRNPRMDRGLIAQIIRGQKTNFKTSNYDFSKITDDQKILAAYYSLPIEKIKTNYNDIDDSFGGPSANTTDFDKPIEASLFLLKQLNNKLSKEILSQKVTCLTHVFPKVSFSYAPEDWLSKSEIERLSEGNNFQISWTKKKLVALGHIFEFFDELTAGISPSLQERKADFPYYTLAMLSIVSLSSLLRNYTISSEFEENVGVLLQSGNWVLRAAAYASLLYNIPIAEESISEFEIFLKDAKNDPDASSHGIRTSYAYHLFKAVGNYNSFPAGIMLDHHFAHLNNGDYTEKYFDRLNFIFDIYRNTDDLTTSIQKHNNFIIQKKPKISSKAGLIRDITKIFRT